MEIKAIFFDIDGTLVNHKTRKVSASTTKSLVELRNKGIKLFICSGRHPSFKNTIEEEVNFIFDGYIFVNGQCLVDAKGTIIYKKMLDGITKKEVYDYLNENSNLSVVVMEENRIYSRTGNDDSIILRYGDVDLKEMLDNEVYQVVIVGDKTLDEDIESKIKGIKNARWSDDFSDFIPVDGGKDKGVYRMLDLFNIDINETMAFGDGGNDIPMLRAVKISVAMGNGQQEVKDIATYVTSDVDNDGIYNALKKYEVL